MPRRRTTNLGRDTPVQRRYRRKRANEENVPPPDQADASEPAENGIELKMKIPVRSRHMMSLLFLTVSIILLLSTIFSKTYKGKDSFTKYALNSKLSNFISANDVNSDELIVPSNDNSSSSLTQQTTKLPAIPEKDAILIDRRVAEDASKKVRLLCWIPSRERYLNTRLKAVNSTWGRRCDKLIVFMTTPNKKINDVIVVNISDARQTLTDKTVFAHKYIYQHYLDKYDWFLKADDDTYVIVENLKFLLSHFNLTIPGYIGCQFKHFGPQGYMSGGAGYAFNAMGIKAIVEKGYNIPGRCRLQGGAEDIETGRCAYKAGVSTFNQLDVQQKQTFFPSNIYANAVGPIPSWATSYTRAYVKAGLSCCSPLLVSFHYTGEKLMYATEFLLYRVVVHGRSERLDKANTMFKGSVADDMGLAAKRRPYPGETLEEYYQKGWREKDTKIYINPNLR